MHIHSVNLFSNYKNWTLNNGMKNTEPEVQEPPKTSFTGQVDIEKISAVIKNNPHISPTIEWMVSGIQNEITGLGKTVKAEYLQKELSRAVDLWLDANKRINMFNILIDNNDAYLLSDIMKYSPIGVRIESHIAYEKFKDGCNKAFSDKQLAEKTIADIKIKLREK